MGELRAFHRWMEITEMRRVGPASFLSGTLQSLSGGLREHAVVSTEIGIGKVNAAAATQALIDAYHPSHLLFSGSAGSLSSDLRVGDVIVADAVAVHDAGAWRDAGFTPGGYMLLNEKGRHASARSLSPSAELLDVACRAASQIEWPARSGELPVRVHTGTVVTGDQVILSAEKKHWLRETFNALAVEMEGSAFAQIATENGVPWLLVRAVSDQADDAADFSFELWQDYMDDEQTVRAKWERARDRVGYILSNPVAPIRAKRFFSDLAFAAANAARLVEAVVAAL
jgi:adenosylhomocysteine nucleosidase